ncbi:MAG: hypothetical protein HQL06_14085 [Nitrospirae bacterium]|nr:hypothetical protein [Nitrospirota bacterium]
MVKVFSMYPAPWGSLWILFAVMVLMLTIAIVIGYQTYSVRHVTLEVGQDGLRIKGGLYGRHIPLGSLLVREAKVLTIDNASPICPVSRTNGIGLPGYAEGWFRLRDGSKALVFMARHMRVLYIPTTEGYALLLTPENPEDVLFALNS